MNLESIAGHLRNLSDRLRSVEAAANVTANALLNNDPDKDESNAAEMLVLHVCEPLGAEIGNIQRMAKACGKHAKAKPAKPQKRKKRPAAD